MTNQVAKCERIFSNGDSSVRLEIDYQNRLYSLAPVGDGLGWGFNFLLRNIDCVKDDYALLDLMRQAIEFAEKALTETEKEEEEEAKPQEPEKEKTPKGFESLPIPIARKRLNALGYGIEGTDEPYQVIFGMIVCLAEQIEDLKQSASSGRDRGR